MITQNDFEYSLRDYIGKNSGFEPNRPYIGFSKVNQCPRKTYREYMAGVEVTEMNHRMAFVGYLFERTMLEMMEKIGICLPNTQAEVFSDFSQIFKGHTDGETSWGDLLEVKSVTVKKFDIINGTKKAMNDHFRQVQLYMHYGNYKRTWVVYVCRETMEIKVICVHYSPRIALEGAKWGQDMVTAVLTHTEPACMCGKCK